MTAPNQTALRDRIATAIEQAKCGHAFASRCCDRCRADAVIADILRSGHVIVSAAAVEEVSYQFPPRSTPYRERRIKAAKEALRQAIECRCETLHAHCYASGCLCPNHAEEVGT